MISRKLFKIIAAAILFLNLVLTPPNVQALPNLTNEVPGAVPVNYTELFFVYFRYGNPAATTTVPNLSVKLEIEGEGFVLIPEEIYDLYHPKEENQTIPQIPVCSNQYAGFDYQISPGFFQNNQLTYGPQSAASVLESSGSNVSELPPRSAGCLRIGLKVSPDAETGQITTLKFNPDVNESAPNLSPGQQTLTLIVGDTISCPNGQALIQGNCQPECQEEEMRNRAGFCVDTEEICGPGKDLFEGKCIPGCLLGQARDDQGTCIDVTSNLAEFLSRIWTVPLLAIVAVLVWIGVRYGYQRFRKMRKD